MQGGAGSIGAAVLFGNATADCQTPYNGGCKVALGSAGCCRVIGECNCRLLDALAGEFRGRGKESHARHIIGECNCRLLDALAGELRGRGKESNVRRIIGECNCRLLDALAGELRGRGKESNVPHIFGECN